MSDTNSISIDTTGLLIGSGGLLGPDVHQALEQYGYSHRLFVRERKGAAANVSSDRVFTGDLGNPKSIEAAVEGVDWIVYVPTNTGEKIIHAENIAIAAKAAGVRLILQTSAMLAGEDPPLSFGIEHVVAERFIENSGVDWITLRPSFFMQSFSMFSKPMREFGKLICPVPSGKIALIDTWDVAECVAACLANPQPYLFQRMTLTGKEALTMTEIASHLSDASNTRVSHIALPPLIVGLIMRWLEKMDPWLVKRLLQLFNALEQNREAAISNQADRLLGTQPLSFAAYLERDRQAQALWPD
ncbi:MAG: hypothetical protein ACJAUG_002670 [Halioglobus sp.]|jgi:uncharacterized protein YbjT (DUF2867 family)